MYLTQLKVSSYRNLKDSTLFFKPSVNLIIGQNGQGKTNLLEAIYLILKGKSFRTSSFEVLGKKNHAEPKTDFSKNHVTPTPNSLSEKPPFYLSGAIQFSEAKITDQIEIQYSGLKRMIKKNGKATSSEAIQSMYPAILFSPESLATVKEGPDLRRDLIDEIVVSRPNLGAETVSDYRKCLRSRNKILKDYLAGKVSLPQTDRWLESINPSFVNLAAKLTAARLEVLKEIENEFCQAFNQIIHSDFVDISVDYVISGHTAKAWSERQISDATQKRLLELRSSEISSGVTLVGPHKHEIKFLFNGNDSRFFCSQGQQRALILAFKIAQIVYHRRTQKEHPILLLDDVLSELDLERKHFLLGLLREQEVNSQIFITTTEDSVPSELVRERLSVYRVKNGVIQLEQ